MEEVVFVVVVVVVVKVLYGLKWTIVGVDGVTGEDGRMPDELELEEEEEEEEEEVAENDKTESIGPDGES